MPKKTTERWFVQNCLYLCISYGFDIDSFMINRVLIRLKVVQITYSYYLNGGGKVASADRELSLSLNSAYSLYHNLLYLLVAVWSHSRKTIAKRQKFKDEKVPRKEILFSVNKFLLQLSENKELNQYIQPEEMNWMKESDLLSSLYLKILDSEVLNEYIQEEKFDYDADKELCRKLYKSIFMEDDELDTVLETQNIYWNGDKSLIDSFVLKTIKSFEEKNGSDQKLQSDYKDERDRTFSIQLLHAGLEAEKDSRAIISELCERWDPNRLAFIDVLIMQIAYAEMLNFPEIPLKVTINEYVEMAKYLSTPNSGSFVNGMLDNIAKELREKGFITKMME